MTTRALSKTVNGGKAGGSLVAVVELDTGLGEAAREARSVATFKFGDAPVVETTGVDRGFVRPIGEFERSSETVAFC
jgi:hypothetical protein